MLECANLVLASVFNEIVEFSSGDSTNKRLQTRINAYRCVVYEDRSIGVPTPTKRRGAGQSVRPVTGVSKTIVRTKGTVHIKTMGTWQSFFNISFSYQIFLHMA